MRTVLLLQAVGFNGVGRAWWGVMYALIAFALVSSAVLFVGVAWLTPRREDGSRSLTVATIVAGGWAVLWACFFGWWWFMILTS